MTTTTALAPREQLKRTLAGFLPSYEKLLPKGYEANRLVTGALVAATRNPELLKCEPQSIAVALATIAQWGLDVGTTAHLVPFGRACTPVVDYKGYIKLMVAAGARKVEAQVVREGDEFSYHYGTEGQLRHVPKAKPDAPILAAYAIVTLRGGVTQFEVMSVEEIEEVRASKSKSWARGPLPSWYARKTVIRRCAKYLPQSGRLVEVLTEDEVLPTAVEPTPEMLASVEPKHRIRDRIVIPTDGYDAETGEVTATVDDQGF